MKYPRKIQRSRGVGIKSNHIKIIELWKSDYQGRLLNWSVTMINLLYKFKRHEV